MVGELTKIVGGVPTVTVDVAELEQPFREYVTI